MGFNLFLEGFLEFEICILSFILVFGTCLLEFQHECC
jgi:hypothetical protein